MIGFIGGGNMAEALIRGITSRGIRDIIVSEPREDRRKYLESSFSIRTTSSNPEAVSSSSIVILAVKLQNMDAVLTEISDSLTEQKVVVSIAAGITLSCPHKRWSMWFNSMQREEPYQVLTSKESLRKLGVPSGALRQVVHGCRQVVS